MPGGNGAKGLIRARSAELGEIFAAVDSSVQFVQGALSPNRFGAKLRPYRSHGEAVSAIEAVGAQLIEDADR